MLAHSPRLPGLDLPADPPGLVMINDQCCMETHEGWRIVAVGGTPITIYAVGDGAAETMAMVNLVKTKASTQVEVAQAFQCSTRQVRRHQRKREIGGQASNRRRGRQPGAVGVVRLQAPAVRAIRKLKDAGVSNREVGRRFGVSEKAIRKLLQMGFDRGIIPTKAKVDFVD